MSKSPYEIRAGISDRIAAGHASAPTPNRRSRDEKLAAGFRPDPTMERLLELRRTDRPAFDAAVRGRAMELGYYEGAKSAHDRLKEAAGA